MHMIKLPDKGEEHDMDYWPEMWSRRTNWGEWMTGLSWQESS
jgi:hypothetical protein